MNLSLSANPPKSSTRSLSSSGNAPQKLREKPLSDSIQFGNPPKTAKTQAAKQSTPNEEPGFFGKARLAGAWSALKSDLRSPKWWIQHGAMAGAITLATCWLPGSQLITIPFWFGWQALASANKGHQNYKIYQKPQASEQPTEKNATTWTAQQKRQGAWDGLKQGVKKGFTQDLRGKLLLSGAICLATCWLPGSQLILIPAFFSTFAAYAGVKGAIEGYENPAAFSEQSKQAGKTEAK
jgi:hypothetical protein